MKSCRTNVTPFSYWSDCACCRAVPSAASRESPDLRSDCLLIIHLSVSQEPGNEQVAERPAATRLREVLDRHAERVRLVLLLRRSRARQHRVIAMLDDGPEVLRVDRPRERIPVEDERQTGRGCDLRAIRELEVKGRGQ